MDSKFAVKVENGRKGTGDDNPSVGPVYRNPLAKESFPPLDSNFKTAWDVFRYLYSISTLRYFPLLVLHFINLIIRVAALLLKSILTTKCLDGVNLLMARYQSF